MVNFDLFILFDGELRKEYFFYDLDVIDFILVVEEKELYVVKVVLIDVLFVFKKMLIN